MSTLQTFTADRPRGRRTLVNGTVLRIEMRRVLRNRRTLLFTFVFPAVMLVFVSSQITGENDVLGADLVANVGAYIMASMAVYGAIMATTAAGASVSIERAAGWSRQLRLTPLRPVSHVVMKMLVAAVLGACATGMTFVVGAVTGRAKILAVAPWWQMALVIVAGSLVFAALGLFMGYLLPSENAMQFLGPILAILAIFGGLFSGPLSADTLYGRAAQWTPIYGLSQIAHWPLTMTTSGAHSAFELSWVVNLVCWGVVFVLGAAWRMRKDTPRV